MGRKLRILKDILDMTSDDILDTLHVAEEIDAVALMKKQLRTIHTKISRFLDEEKEGS